MALRRLLVAAIALALIVAWPMRGLAERGAPETCDHGSPAHPAAPAHHPAPPMPAQQTCADCCLGCIPATKLPTGSAAAERVAIPVPVVYWSAARDSTGRSIRPDPAPPRPSA